MDYSHIKNIFSKGSNKGKKIPGDASSTERGHKPPGQHSVSSSGLTTSPYAEAAQGPSPRHGALPIHGSHGAYSTAPGRNRQGFTIGTQGSAFGNSSSPPSTSPPATATQLHHEQKSDTNRRPVYKDDYAQPDDTRNSQNSHAEEANGRPKSPTLRLETPRVAPPQPPTTPMDALIDPMREKLTLNVSESQQEQEHHHSDVGSSTTKKIGTKNHIETQPDEPPPRSPARLRNSDHHHHQHHRHHHHQHAPVSELTAGTSSGEDMIKIHHQENTTVKTHYAQPVYHETIKPHVHHIEQEQIHKEIHNHDVYHRVLPVIDIKVLPTKHYAYDGSGQLIEIADPHADSSTGHLNRNWVIAETLSKQHPERAPDRDGKSYDSELNSRRQFTARVFEEDEGDEKVYIRKDGVAVTESTWIHHPTLEDGGQKTGQTVPMIFRHVGQASDTSV